ncbi:MAG TPA: tRNA (adenosine(37)-N6)-threonylcarbamoyltransferase complex dimerization subunit type 1 TsaB [Steroidobacteraceae bacterium]|nr:tRNA (adenosine(37)-N6)-threonylcarbamoyltransferase complex dimerization subunit type 1 TsaB [Steroidobacteraceae bacterium]
MRILALDTATERSSVAVHAEDREISRTLEGARGQADRILVLIDEVLEGAALTLRELDAIAASVGPGAFTGVRIGVAVAQGLAFGANLPVIPVTTLEALAFERLVVRASAPDEVALACLDARMGEVYWGCYVRDVHRGVRALAPPRVSAPGAVQVPAGHAHGGRILGIGRGFEAHRLLGNLPHLELDEAARAAGPDARAMARLGIIRLAAGEAVEPAALEPLYLRDRVALTVEERRAARGE